MLTKSVLCVPPRGGKAHKRHLEKFTLRRCERWLSGERITLWNELPDRAARRTTKGSPDLRSHQDNRAIALARDGQLSKACKALLAVPPVECSEQTVRVLQSKHPIADVPPDLSDLAPPCAAPEIASDLIRKSILNFPRGSAPGPSGLRPQHLKDAIKSAHGDQCAEHITALVSLLADGAAPRQLAPHLAGAALFGLPKADGGLRPIAVGETLRRLVAKALCD
eukprot:gene18724-20528_t